MIQAWRRGQERLRQRQPPAPDPISGLLDSVLTPDTGGVLCSKGVSVMYGDRYCQMARLHSKPTYDDSCLLGEASRRRSNVGERAKEMLTMPVTYHSEDQLGG
ncbi:unnamed protein product [Schistocephalus solidus]|uniref:Uncharacterized protein n=1 Tax=Schistocephalus solidus TaxID=70667 RepID=A0A183T5F2_SCHSO|nr:unnamed protein product [Schistocephalus solidus]